MKRKVFLTIVLLFFIFTVPAYAMEADSSQEKDVSPSVQMQEMSETRDNRSKENISLHEEKEPEKKVIKAQTVDSTSQTSPTEEAGEDKDFLAEEPLMETSDLEDKDKEEALDLLEEETPLKDEATSVQNSLDSKNEEKSMTIQDSHKDSNKCIETIVKETDSLDQKIEAKELKDGDMIKISLSNIQDNTMDPTQNDAVVEVRSFEELKAAINEATGPVTIKIMESFDLTEKIIIGKDQDITLTASNQKNADVAWKPIEQPADYKDKGEDEQREVIKEGRKRGEEALEQADLNNNPLPSNNDGSIIIKRAIKFVTDTLFEVIGKLTLGTEDSAIYIDGNNEVQTALDDSGTVINVSNGGQLTMKNAVVMNSKNGHGYTGPIKVKKGGSFTMDGGRISNNTSYEQIDPDYTRPTSAGAVYVDPGANFTMNNGLIDNNNGGMTGGIFAGSLFGSSGDPAIVEIKGGIIANNKSNTRFRSGGGVTAYPKSELTITDGIIAGNQSGSGGGVAISDQFISEFSNIVNSEYANTPADYEKHLKENKAEANLNGGLIYQNQASVGGGIYVDTNHVNFNKTMILDNESLNFGGGIYVSFPPRIQILKNLLVTENNAIAKWLDNFGGGNGGGLWNCPTGYVHIGDGHTVYVFNNKADRAGKDITFSKKTKYFLLNKENIQDKFYSHISPVTKDGNIIKFLEDGKTGVYIPEHMSYTDLMTHLRAEYNAALKEEAWRNANTFILGNTSRNGGGIGSNANLETPEDEGDYDLKISKKWDSTFNKEPEDSVIGEIFIVPMDKDEAYVRSNYGSDPNLYKYGEITLSKDNKWEGQIYDNPYATIDGLPAKLKDKGLPFTAEELAKRGLKYLVMEKGDKYFSEVTEIKAEDKKDVEVGQIEVERIASKDLGTEYDDPEEWHESSIYLYKYDSKNQRLILLDQSDINAGSSWKTTLKASDLLNEISKIEYYGKERVFIEYGEEWANDIKGYHSKDNGYALVLHENEDGSLTLHVPYLWIQEYDDKFISGFEVKQLQDKTIVKNEGSLHEFVITNYEYGKLDVTKDWKTKLDEGKLPESIKLYLILDGRRVIDSYDEDGNPIYKSIELTKKDGWKGSFEKLDPRAITQGRYSLEEDILNNFVPKIVFVPTEDKIIFRIEYANNYRPVGEKIDDGLIKLFPTYDHFKDFMGDITIKLIVDGKDFDSKDFTWDKIPHPVLVGEFLNQLNKAVVFGQGEKSIILPLNGQNLKIDSYDLETNEPGLTKYNFYIKKDQNGFYTLYVPRLIIDGVPYDLFNVTKVEPNKHGSYPKESFVEPQEESKPKVEVTNYDGPNHEIEFLKEWINGQDKIPEEITLVLTDRSGNKTEIKLTKKENWTKTLSDLEGLLKDSEYSVAEIELDNFTSEIEQGKTLVVIKSVDKEGKEISFNYESKELNEALSSGKYRYRIFELKDKSIEFNQENLDKFIRVEKQEDGSYIIYFADTVSLTERLSIKAKNSYNPPETPEEPPVTPPEEPPVTPPEEPPVTPPEEPPVTPAIPPVEPVPNIPEEPKTPIVPKQPVPPVEKLRFNRPQEDTNKAPKTFDPGIGSYMVILLISAVALGVIAIGKKREA